MHVKDCILTQAIVSDYLGKEIPNYEQLGLKPDLVYGVLRDPVELAKGKDTIANLLILSKHVAISSEELPKELIIGSVGSDIDFDGKNMTGSITFNDGTYINAIDSGLTGLSLGYGFDPVLENGSFEGKAYQVRMTNIAANHVALVDEPRVKEAQVADSERGFNFFNNKRGSMNKFFGMLGKSFAKDANVDAGELKEALLEMMAEEKREDAGKIIDKMYDCYAKDKKAKDEESEGKEDDKDKKTSDKGAKDEDDKDDKKDKTMDSDSINKLVTTAVSNAKNQWQKESMAFDTACSLAEKVLGGKFNQDSCESNPEKVYDSVLKIKKIACDSDSLESKKAKVEVLASLAQDTRPAIFDSTSINKSSNSIMDLDCMKRYIS